MNNTSLAIEPEETHPENGGGDFVVDNETDNDLEEQNADEPNIIELNQFLMEFGEDLMDAVSKLNPRVYDDQDHLAWNQIMDGLKRQAFYAQRQRVQAVCKWHRIMIEWSTPARSGFGRHRIRWFPPKWKTDPRFDLPLSAS